MDSARTEQISELIGQHLHNSHGHTERKKTIWFRNDENRSPKNSATRIPTYINVATLSRSLVVTSGSYVPPPPLVPGQTVRSDPERPHLEKFSENSLAIFTSRTWRSGLSVLAVADDAR